MLKGLKKVYDYRDSIWILTVTDLKMKYAGSTLGFFWSILEPLLIISIYSLIFPLLLKARFVDWVLFFLAGFIPFRYFERGIREVTTALVKNRDILNQVNIPSEVIPISTALSNSISFISESFLFFGLILIAGVKPTYLLLLFPLLFLIEFFIILGFGFYLTVSFVNFRDLEYILNVVFQALMFLTPVVYRLDYIPEIYRGVYLMNPISRLVMMYQSIALYTTEPFRELIPIFDNIGLLFVFSVIVLTLGYLSFIKRKHAFEGRL